MNQKFENFWASDLRFSFLDIWVPRYEDKTQPITDEDKVRKLCKEAYERGQEDGK